MSQDEMSFPIDREVLKKYLCQSSQAINIKTWGILVLFLAILCGGLDILEMSKDDEIQSAAEFLSGFNLD